MSTTTCQCNAMKHPKKGKYLFLWFLDTNNIKERPNTFICWIYYPSQKKDISLIYFDGCLFDNDNITENKFYLYLQFLNLQIRILYQWQELDIDMNTTCSLVR